jgi:hypothetical protein
MKLAVGVMLSSYGMFWGAEGAGASWPGGDAALLAIIPGVLASAIAMGWAARRTAKTEGFADLAATPGATSDAAAASERATTANA